MCFDGPLQAPTLALGVTLQGLEFFDEILELLLDLINPSFLFLTLGALLGRFVFGLRHRIIKGRHFSRGPYQNS